MMMSRNELIDQLAELFETSPDQLTDETSPSQISGWDSLSTLTMIFLLEKLGAGEIALEDALTLKTIGEVLTFAKTRGLITD